MKALLDFIPLILFFYLYSTVDPKDKEHPFLQWFGATGGVDNNHILVATAGLIISMVIVYVGMFILQKYRLEKQQWFVLLMTLLFGGVTLILSDDYYIRLKAVLINLAFAGVFFFAPWFMKNKQPIIQRLLAPILSLSEAGWKKLNLVWGGMFVVMAGLHFLFAFVLFQGKYWGEFTAVGDISVMLTFIVVQFYVLRKHLKSPE
ncbi:MAG: septation protein IspZ [Acinetobacter sp.]|nr:septation protein IspZ [Acinetobacter sp.]